MLVGTQAIAIANRAFWGPNYVRATTTESAKELALRIAGGMHSTVSFIINTIMIVGNLVVYGF